MKAATSFNIVAGGATELSVCGYSAEIEMRRSEVEGETRMADDPFEVVDPSGLTDADWAEISKLQQAYKEGGKRALNKAMAALANDPIRYVAVVGAFFPDMIREAIKDSVAEAGLTEEDLREMVRKLESPAPDQ
jgi:hypothetical protein